MVSAVLWDVGYYEIDYPTAEYDSDSNEERRRKRKRRSELGEKEDDEEDWWVPGRSDDELTAFRLGRHQEDLFRAALSRVPGTGKSRSMHFTLKGGYKVDPLLEF